MTRGRGRGRGRFGFGQGRFAKEESYEIFPEIKELPDVNLRKKEEEYRALISWGNDLLKFWISSPYHLVDVNQDAERNVRRAPLSDYMKMTEDYVPAELVSRKVKRSNKKVRWDPQSDLQKLDIFEKLDQGESDKDKKDDEDEDEDEDEDNENVEEEEADSGDDYEKNIDFDDDEDDFNMAEEPDGDEDYY